jgi:hypothetical protein
MAYDPTIPQSSDTPASSQPQILSNFAGISTLVNVNHVDFDLPDQGKHKWVSMPDQALAPATLAAEVALYGFTSPETAVTELYVRRPLNGVQIPMTERSGTTNGWTMLPSGILMKWGTDGATGSANIDANSFGKAFVTLYHVQVTNQTILSTSDTYVMGGQIVGTTFDVYVGNRTTPGTDATANVNWFVIGV